MYTLELLDYNGNVSEVRTFHSKVEAEYFGMMWQRYLEEMEIQLCR